MKKFTLISLVLGLFLAACASSPAAVVGDETLVRVYALED